MPTDDAQLVVRGLTKEFTTAAGPLSILRGVDLSMTRGEALAITGPSGSGKSTFLYIVGTLDTPTAGSVRILGRDPFAASANDLAGFRRDSIGFIFQDHHLLPQCTVLENVLVPTISGTGAGAAQEERARKLLDRVGLAGRLSHRPAQLSGGERQRVAVCRALINRPVLLLADEPTGNLDQETATGIGSLLLELNREEQTILICVTHSTELASRFARHLQLSDGKLVE